MKAYLQLQQLFCSRENQLASRFNQLNEKSTLKKIEVDVLLLCETFLHTEALMLVQIPILSMYYIDRGNTTSGEIAMYVNDKFHHKDWLDLDVFEEGFLN